MNASCLCPPAPRLLPGITLWLLSVVLQRLPAGGMALPPLAVCLEVCLAGPPGQSILDVADMLDPTAVPVAA